MPAHPFAPLSHGIVHPHSPSHSDAYAAYVITVIKGPQRNRVFAATYKCKVQRISFMRTVGNTVVRKDFVPRAAIDAYVGALDATGCVLNIKNSTHAFVSNLRATNLANHGRGVVDVHRLAEPLTGQGVARRIVRRVRSDNFKDITTVRQTGAVYRVEIFADVLLQEAKRRFVERAVIDRVLKRVTVAIFRLPLQRAGASLIESSRRRLWHCAEERWIKPGRFNIRIHLNLNLLLQGDARWQNIYRQHLRSDIARQVRNAYVFEPRFPAGCLVRSVQHGAPLDESGFGAGDLRAVGVIVGGGPVAPCFVRSLTVSTACLQVDRAPAAPPDSAPRCHQFRVAHRRFVAAFVCHLATKTK